MPAAGAFLQGTAFVGPASTLTSSNPAYLPGATVSLYQGTTASAANLVGTTTTDSHGAYLFSDVNVASSYGKAGLNPGVYTLVETPPAGYVNSGTQVLSQLDPATAVNSSTNSTLPVSRTDRLSMEPPCEPQAALDDRLI